MVKEYRVSKSLCRWHMVALLLWALLYTTTTFSWISVVIICVKVNSTISTGDSMARLTEGNGELFL